MPTLVLLAHRFDLACSRREQSHTAYRSAICFHANGDVDRAFVNQAFRRYDQARSEAAMANRKLVAAALG